MGEDFLTAIGRVDDTDGGNRPAGDGRKIDTIRTPDRAARTGPPDAAP
jgi:hypothetical protein